MTGGPGRELEHWMAAAAVSGEPSLQSFVTGLRTVQDAVTVGPTLQRRPGSVEGHVNRFKTLKRQIYGRASSLVIRSAVAGGHARHPAGLVIAGQSQDSGDGEQAGRPWMMKPGLADATREDSDG